MATTTFPADKPEDDNTLRRGRPPNVEKQAQEDNKEAQAEAERKLLHEPDPNDPYRPLSPPQPMPMDLQTLKTGKREMLPEAAVAAGEPSKHEDRRAAGTFKLRGYFIKPEETDDKPVGEEGEDEDEAIERTYDPRNPVLNATWTNEEGGMGLKERRKLRAESRLGVNVPAMTVPAVSIQRNPPPPLPTPKDK